MAVPGAGPHSMSNGFAVNGAGKHLALKAVWDRLTHLERLPQNWDAGGASPPHAGAVAALRELIAAVYEQFATVAGPQAVPHTVAPLVHGGVRAEWRGPGGELVVQASAWRALKYRSVTRNGDVEYTIQGDGATIHEVITQIASIIAPAGLA